MTFVYDYSTSKLLDYYYIYHSRIPMLTHSNVLITQVTVKEACICDMYKVILRVYTSHTSYRYTYMYICMYL